MLCILIVSLPMQGSVAAIKFPCMMSHSLTAAQDTEAMDDCDEPDMVMPKAQQLAGTDDDHEAPCHQGSHDKHSSCRSCCAGAIGTAAPPPCAAVIPPTAHVVDDDVSPIVSLTGGIPSRIERPPRT